LPFLSYGGSSLLMSFVMIGLLLRLSAEAGIDAVHPAD
jgi:cell division protein FtsW (lipid II flippase)